jgi:uncharacterized Zn finger protein
LYILQKTVEDLPIEQNEGALERARTIAQNPERIEYLPARKLWVVKGTTGADYVVKLFKDGGDFAAQCSCPATIRCCHIMAAMIWLNMDPKANYQTTARKKRESRNVSSMRTKALPKSRRKTGGKNNFPRKSTAMKRKRTPDDDSLASEPPRTEEEEAMFRGNASQERTLSTIMEEHETLDDDFDNVNMPLKLMVEHSNQTIFVIFFYRFQLLL